jgi:hypothetical protein
MRMLLAPVGLALILLVLVDGFETILQPRRITHRFRYARFYYTNVWRLWRSLALSFGSIKRREAFLSTFGPLSLLGLFLTWIIGLIVGFGLLQWAVRAPLHSPDGHASLSTYLYLSGTTFFTLGMGDVTPTSALGHVLAVAESGLGFAFLAVIISYLPVLYQAYSRREVTISLLDARAGSPPSAAQVLLRLARSGNLPILDTFLAEWESWCAELLESHLSFPVLIYYRSQHDNQSWLAALTTILDTCALLIVEVQSQYAHRAQLTFAMARHAAVDLNLVLKSARRPIPADRLAPDQRQVLRDVLRSAGLVLQDPASADARLVELRAMYEPFLFALSARFLFTLPPVMPPDHQADNWQRSSWMPPSPGIGNLTGPPPDDDHFA